MRRLIVVLTILMVAVSPALALETNLYIYRDGYARVTHVLFANSGEPVEIPLLGEPEEITVVDEKEEPIYYVVENLTLSIFPLNDGTVTITYYTPFLTTKSGVFWTVNFNSTFPVTLTLPDNASLISINSIPDKVTPVGNSLILELSPGVWNITYIITSVGEPYEGQEEGQGGGKALGFPINPIYVVYVAIALLIAGVYYLSRRRKGKGVKGLRPEDREIVEFLKKVGGSAYESEIQKSLALPKTSAWRAIKRLERLGIVKVTKEDGRNRVTLS
jgi:uncharacterized membrane protein